MPKYTVKLRNRLSKEVEATDVAIQGMGMLIVFTNGRTSNAQVVAIFPTELVAGVYPAEADGTADSD